MTENVKNAEETFYFNKSENKIGSQCTRHYHSSFEIYYLKSGVCNYFIDNRSYEIKEGDLVLIPEGVIHKTNYPCVPHTRMLINCSSDYVPESVSELIPSMTYIYRNSHITTQIEIILEKITEEYGRDDPFRDESLKCLTFELFFLLSLLPLFLLRPLFSLNHVVLRLSLQKLTLNLFMSALYISTLF